MSLSPKEARDLIKQRGWDVASLARRWKLSRCWVSRKLNSAEREPHWNDAIAGLPDRDTLPLEQQHRTVRRPRKASRAWLPKGRFLDRTIELGSEVVVEREIGDDAPYGAQGLVIQIENTTPPRLRIVFASGYIDWFDAAAFMQQLHATGRTLPGLTGYRAGSDDQVRADLRARRLHFRFES